MNRFACLGIVGFAAATLSAESFNMATCDDWQIIGANQDSNRVVIVDGRPCAAPKYRWEWCPRTDPKISPQDAAGIVGMDECKLRDGGRTLLFTSFNYFGAVDVATRQTKSLFRVGGNPHSIEVLPDGRFAVANASDGYGFMLADNAEPFDHAKQRTVVAFPASGAHGVEWDAARNCLWGLAYTNLHQFAYDSSTMTLRELAVYDYTAYGCGDAAGHDLVPDGKGGYFFTNHKAVWHFDPDTKRFTLASSRRNAKSYSPSAAHGAIYLIPRQSWWSDRIIIDEGECGAREIGPFPGAKFYKARWVRTLVPLRLPPQT